MLNQEQTKLLRLVNTVHTLIVLNNWPVVKAVKEVIKGYKLNVTEVNQLVRFINS